MGLEYGKESGKEETLNMQVVTMKEFTEFIRDAIEMENFDTPILCLGKSGIGKTESIANAVTEKLGIGLVELSLASYGETDLIGVPYFADGKKEGVKFTKFADMNILPHLASTGDGDSPDVGILLLDEITATSRPVRSVALKLLDASRKIGDYVLPPKWIIVVLGNGPTDGGMYNGLEYAMISRAMCMRVKPDFETWKEWAIGSNVHPAVIGFIQQNGKTDMLHQIKSAESGGYEEKECNPRSWVKLSNCLYKKEAKIGGLLSERQVQIYAGAAVGANLAVQFATFYANKAELVPIDDILDGTALNMNPNTLKMETIYIQEPQLVYAMTEILDRNESYINDNELPPKAELEKIRNIIKWLMHLEKREMKKASLTRETIQDMGKATPNFATLFTSVDGIDEAIPEYGEYATVKREIGTITRQLGEAK